MYINISDRVIYLGPYIYKYFFQNERKCSFVHILQVVGILNDRTTQQRAPTYEKILKSFL